MRSGHDDYTGIWGNAYYDDEFKAIRYLRFVQRTFKSADTLVSIGPIGSPDEVSPPSRHCRDGTVEIPFEGQEFDKAKWRVVPGGWDHEHCKVCRFSISNGHTYWANEDGVLLCDACHEHYVLRKT